MQTAICTFLVWPLLTLTLYHVFVSFWFPPKLLFAYCPWHMTFGRGVSKDPKNDFRHMEIFIVILYMTQEHNSPSVFTYAKLIHVHVYIYHTWSYSCNNVIEIRVNNFIFFIITQKTIISHYGEGNEGEWNVQSCTMYIIHKYI